MYNFVRFTIKNINFLAPLKFQGIYISFQKKNTFPLKLIWLLLSSGMALRPSARNSGCCTTRAAWPWGKRGIARRSFWRTACPAAWTGRRLRRTRSCRRAVRRPTRATTRTTCSSTPSWPRTRSTCASWRRRSARVAGSVRTAAAAETTPGRRRRPAANRARRTGGCRGDWTPRAERRRVLRQPNEFWIRQYRYSLVDSCLLIFVISDTQEKNFRRARDPNKIIVALFLLDFQRCQKYNYKGTEKIGLGRTKNCDVASHWLNITIFEKKVLNF